MNIRQNYFMGCQLNNIIHISSSILFNNFTFRATESFKATEIWSIKAADDLLLLPFCKSELFSGTFLNLMCLIIKLWNDLLSDIHWINNLLINLKANYTNIYYKFLCNEQLTWLLRFAGIRCIRSLKTLISASTLDWPYIHA